MHFNGTVKWKYSLAGTRIFLSLANKTYFLPMQQVGFGFLVCDFYSGVAQNAPNHRFSSRSIHAEILAQYSKAPMKLGWAEQVCPTEDINWCGFVHFNGIVKWKYSLAEIPISLSLPVKPISVLKSKLAMGFSL